jgi:hypothetical protein
VSPGRQEDLDPFITADRRPILNPLVGRPAPTRTDPVLESDVASVQVLNESEASRVQDIVYELRPYWRLVGTRLPFFTLGAASYIHAARRQEEYVDLASRLNPILATRFADLYARLLTALSDNLGLPVTFLDFEGLALPGFHIYQFHPELDFLRPQVHKDLQHQRIDWTAIGTPDFAHPFSFTLAVALPSAGAGLNVWPSTFVPNDSRTGLPATGAGIATVGPTYHAYRVGELVIHSGLRYHQIAPMTGVLPGENRLTLQGHGLWFGREWRVYW